MRWVSRYRVRAVAWISAVGIVLLGLGWVIPAALDQSRWLSWFEQKASLATGRAVTIGKMSLHLLPRPGFDAEHVTIANPSWTSQPFLAQIDHLSAQFSFSSLWHRTFQVANLKADGVQIDVETNAELFGNWHLVPQNTKPNQPSTGHFSGMTSLDLNQLTVHYLRDKRDFGLWQLPQVHIDAQPLWREVNASVVLNHAQRSLSLRASIDALDAPSHGVVSVSTGAARVVIDARQLQSARIPADTFAMQLDATRLDDLLAFFDIASRPIAPAQISADMRADGRHIDMTQLAARLGELRVGGTAQFDTGSAQPTLHAQLSIPRLDWVRMLADAGRPPLPPKPPGELFRTHRLPWRILAAVHGVRADIDLQIAELKTRSGVELTNASAQVHINDGQLQATTIHAQLLGGTASGALHLTGADQTAQLTLQLHDVSLHEGLRAMGKTTPLTDGPIQLSASVHAHGESMKALAATLTGPVTIRLGPTRIMNAAGARNEELLTGLLPFFSAHDTGEIQLECGSAELPFQNGRASASSLVGVRSQASELLTRGDLDLRAQTVDLRGRVRSRSGLSLGLSALSGDIRFSGPLVHPLAKLDPAGTPGAVARVGAAVMTAGLSLIGTALWDHAHPGANPCEAVFAHRSATSMDKALR
jgi:uncharacterized protein involved in outer membrane biogenesis